MSKAGSFVDLAVAGRVLADEIDDFIESWHVNPKGELYEFLGMTEREYELYLNSEEWLPLIISAHTQGKDVLDLAELAKSGAIAARSADAGKLDILTRWIERHRV